MLLQRKTSHIHPLTNKPHFIMCSWYTLNSTVDTNTRVPNAQGKQGKWPKKFLVRENTGIWKFCQNTEKTQGIWFAQVVNSLILKIKDVSIFALEISKNFQFIFEGG